MLDALKLGTPMLSKVK